MSSLPQMMAERCDNAATALPNVLHDPGCGSVGGER